MGRTKNTTARFASSFVAAVACGASREANDSAAVIAPTIIDEVIREKDRRRALGGEEPPRYDSICQHLHIRLDNSITVGARRYLLAGTS